MVFLTGYHATDKSNINSIIKNGFVYNVNKHHWLGNGVYFFESKELALWWIKKSCNLKYGAIEKSAILEVNIKSEEELIADLRKFEVYKFFNDKFNEYKNTISKEQYNKSMEEKTIRCAFFEWIKSKAKIDVIIGVFFINNFKEILSCQNNSLADINIRFPEVQICVYNIGVIKEIKEMGEKNV